MANSVAVVDYGMGNLRSVSQAVQHAADQVGVEVFVTSDPDVVRKASRVVLPGQGAMPDCMRELRDSGLQASVLEAAASKPLFGVCVGMQMLLSHSHEGPTDGLGLIPTSNGVHHDSEEQRRPLYHRLVADGTLPGGHATDDGVGLVYRGTELVEAVADRPGDALGEHDHGQRAAQLRHTLDPVQQSLEPRR